MPGVTAAVGDVVVLAPGGRDAVAIVGGLRQGSPEAALLLFDRVAPRVNRLVWRVLGADGEHDDVVQQVFANVLASARSLRDAASLDGWVVAITLNTIRRELRRRRVRRLLHLQAAPPEARSPELDPETRMIARRFYAALEGLAADDRIAFALRVVEEYSLDEVAAACGCSLATAKRRIARAGERLQAAAAADPVLDAWLRSHRP